jgi:hypothetical protein
MKTMAITLLGLLVLGMPARAAAAEWVTISAPIFPQVLKLYEHEGANFPATAEEEAAVAHDASLIFETLLAECQADYPGIVVLGSDDPPLTPEQLTANFDLVARCSYEKYTAKPYWIPQLVDDVDICGTELGAEWRMPTEADLAAFTDEDFAFLQATLTTMAGGDWWGGFYFSLKIYVRAGDGTLAMGDLTPGALALVAPLPSTVNGTSTSHLEGSIVLRCLRVTPAD